MDLVTLVAAAESAATEGESHAHSETLFIVVGIVLAAFAVLVAALGIRKEDLSDAATRAITALGVALSLAAMAAMVVIST